ncbi:unnamed protein product [marine sediment metagenome]|uniref:Uncharacterized protein n=1 Tax=marine sediment metagenome TaxID=412755 RepID=X1JSF8_9ZZZZ
MVQRLAPAFSCSDSYLQVILNLILPDKVIKASGSEAGIKAYILGFGLT